MQNIRRIFIYLIDGIDAARMIRHGDHRLNFRKINLDHTVIISGIRRRKSLISLRPAVDGKIFFRFFIGFPDGRKAGGLGRHDVDADPIIHGKT